nr:hypothetical protein [uncultured Desulfobacter sp.]
MKQDNDRKRKLIDLGPDALADALLNLAVHSDETDDLIVAATGKGGVEAVYADENIWLTQKMMGVLYDVETHTVRLKGFKVR